MADYKGIIKVTDLASLTLLWYCYSSNLLTPTWPLCKNILSVDYERSISFRKCNRWRSFEIVHVCLNNKKCYNIQYDYDVRQWRLGRGVSEHCLQSERRGFEPQQISFSIIILVSSSSIWLTNQAIPLHQTQTATDLFCKLLVLMISFYGFYVFSVHCFSSAVLLNKIKL